MRDSGTEQENPQTRLKVYVWIPRFILSLCSSLFFILMLLRGCGGGGGCWTASFKKWFLYVLIAPRLISQHGRTSSKEGAVCLCVLSASPNRLLAALRSHIAITKAGKHTFCIIKWLEEGHFLENVQEQFLRDKCEVKCCSRDESVNLQGNCLECSASSPFHYSMN